MKLNNKKILYIIVLIFVLISTNITTYYFSKNYTTKWFKYKIIGIEKNNYTSYPLRTGQFENVLYIYKISDTSYFHFKDRRKIEYYPFVAKKISGKLVYIDITNDYNYRVKKFYSIQNEKQSIHEGDTLWIDGWVSDEIDSNTKFYPISLNRIYIQASRGTWTKQLFEKMLVKPKPK